jgi:hypothetical protein
VTRHIFVGYCKRLGPEAQSLFAYWVRVCDYSPLNVPTAPKFCWCSVGGVYPSCPRFNQILKEPPD